MTARARTAFVTAATAIATLGSCTDGATLAPVTPVPPATPAVHVVGATLTLEAGGEGVLAFSAHNAGAEPDRLTGAACPCAGRAEVVGQGVIEPEVTGLFGPNGGHVVLRGLDDAIRPGDRVRVTLTFALAGEVPTRAEVVAS